MDKKNYLRQGSNKTLSNDSRKSSDVIASKQLPRNGRRRENPNQTNSKQDPQRINNKSGGAAKARPNFDKRPARQRASGGGGSGPGNAGGSLGFTANAFASGTGLALIGDTPRMGPVDFDGTDVAAVIDTDHSDEMEVELNSVYAPGSKKHNLNHLLNFHYAPRETEHSIASGGYNSRSSGANRSYVRKSKYNKEQFLQANCQFVVKSSADLVPYIASPDTLVDWSLIEQINIQTTEEPQCPICLYPPIAAKLTRCGHAYCWPCILHYLALSDKTWRKCPICYEAIHMSDLKSTVTIQQSSFKVGNFVTLQLMCRKQNSFFIEKVDDCIQPSNACIPNISDETDKKRFSKFLYANSNAILSIIERERMELTSDEDDSPEFIFFQQALDLLTERKASILKEKGVKEVVPKESMKALSLQSDKNSQSSDSNDEVSEETSSKYSSEENIPPPSPGANGSEEKKAYYFYQSVDGQNIFLHNLNVKMLQEMYGSLDKSPRLLKARIIQKESFSMTEDFRRRLKYLQHLPLTCQFEVVEVQLEPPIISPEVVDKFRDDIINRQKMRMRRAREEKKRERQINEINDRQMGKMLSRSANIDIQSPQQFPSCGFEDFLSGNSISDPPLGGIDSSLDSSPPHQSQGNYTSFAKMLSSPKKEFWPSLGISNGNTNESMMPSSSAENPWGSRLSNFTNKRKDSRYELLSDINGDDVLLSRQSLGDVLAEALEKKKATTNKKNPVTKSASGPCDSNDASNGGNRKSKKNKKTLLFSTGINFNGAN